MKSTKQTVALAYMYVYTILRAKYFESSVSIGGRGRRGKINTTNRGLQP